MGQGKSRVQIHWVGPEVKTQSPAEKKEASTALSQELF